MRLALVPAIISVVWMLSAASFDQPPSPSPLDPDWSLVANSDWILRGRLRVPKEELDEAIRTGKGDYLTLKLDVITVIKGPVDFPVEHMECSYWSGSTDYMPPPREVRSLDGIEILVFNSGAYVAQDKRAISRFDPKKGKSLKREVLNQRLIVENFAQLPAAKPDEFEGTVKELISKMLVKETKQKSVYALQRLDPRAVPSIIRLMDDRRPLPESQDLTTFINTSPKAFEALVHYKPKVALEALSTVLATLTHQSFGQIYNGSTDQERKQVVDAWRVYLHYRISAEAKLNAKPPAPAK